VGFSQTSLGNTSLTELGAVKKKIRHEIFCWRNYFWKIFVLRKYFFPFQRIYLLKWFFSKKNLFVQRTLCTMTFLNIRKFCFFHVFRFHSFRPFTVCFEMSSRNVQCVPFKITFVIFASFNIFKLNAFCKICDYVQINMSLLDAVTCENIILPISKQFYFWTRHSIDVS